MIDRSDRDVEALLQLHLSNPKRNRRRMAVLSAVILAAACGTIGSFALANSGSVSASVTPPAGAPSTGQSVSVDTAIASSISVSNGDDSSAKLDKGVVLGRISVTPVDAAKIKAEVYWTDPYDATDELRSPHAQISMGLYYPVHSGSCVSASKDTWVNTYVNVTDSGTTYCAVLDKTASGSQNVAEGKIMESVHQPGGFLLPDLSDGGSLPACSSVSSANYSAAETSPSNWCQPSSVSGSGVIYVASAILTPGGIPQGQQSQLSSLHFFINVTQD